MKLIKILLGLLVFLVLVVVGGVFAFLNFADPNDFKPMITEKVMEATGRELTLGGDIEWGFWPKIRLNASGIALSNAQGFGDEPFFMADNIQIAVATLPLLSKRLEMDTVVLHGVSANLAVDESGVSNWDDLAGGAEEEERHGGDGLAAIILGGVDIQNAYLSYKDASSGQDVVISNVNASTGPLTFGDPVEFKLSLTAVANEPALDSDVNLTGTVAYDLDNEHYVISPLALNTLLRGDHLPGGKATIDFGAAIDINMDKETATISDLKLTGLGTDVSGNFEATDIEDERPSANGQLNVKGADIAAIFNAFQLPVGKQLAGVKDRGFDFETAFDANMDSGEVTLQKLSGHLLGATLAGAFNAQNANTDEPSAKGNIKLSGPDLPTLLAVVGTLQGADAETLKSLNAALAKAKSKSFSLAADLDADLSTGKAALPKLEAKLLGNDINGELIATNANTDEPAVTGKLRASGPDFPTLLTVAAQFNGADAKTIKSLSAALKNSADKSFTVAADIDADMDKGTAKLSNLKAKLLGNDINGNVSATKIDSDKPAATGSLTAKGADLPALLAIASQFPEDGSAIADIGARLAKEKNKAFNIALGFAADLGAGKIDLNKLSADLLGLNISGGLKGSGVDFEKGKGSLDGSVKVTASDLGVLLRATDNADLAKSVKTLNIDAGVKGSLADLRLSPLSLTSKVQAPDVKKAVDLKVTAGEARANLDKDTLTIKDLAVTGLGLNAKANLDVKSLSKDLTYTGNLNIPAFNLKQLMKSLSMDVPKTGDPKALTSVKASSNIVGTAKGVKLQKVAIGLDKTKINGHFHVNDFTGPDLNFKFEIDSLNADNYTEPSASGKGKAVTPEAAAAGAATGIPVDTLRAIKLKGNIKIANLIMSGAKMKNIQVVINGDKGTITVKPVKAALYEGNYLGDIFLNARSKVPVLKLKTKLNKVNVEPLIIDTVGNNMLSGIVNFDAALNSVGKDGDQMKKKLNGKATFNTTNGVFRGVDAVAVLRAVEQMIECKCPVPVPKGGETKFDQLGGTITAKNGVLHNQDLVMAGDGFKIGGKGMLANLHNNTLKYNLTLEVDEQTKQAGVSDYNLGGYKVPIKCRGNIEEPSCLPDFGGIMSQIVKNAAKEKVEKAIGDKIKDSVGGDAGEAIKKLLKF